MSKITITVILGDGIGPSIIESPVQILTHTGYDFEYEYADAGLVAPEKHGKLLPQATLDLIEKNKVTLKGPLTTPVGRGFSSINVSCARNSTSTPTCVRSSPSKVPGAVMRTSTS